MIRYISLFIHFSILITALAAEGCSSSEDESAFKFGIGKYRFTMSDSTGKKMAEGTLEVKTYASDKISGTYEFTNVYVKDFPGQSTMDGLFEGNVIPSEKKVFINTNPRIADANVFWNMLIKKNSVSGEWNYSVFRGEMNKGKVRIFK
ncbi:MAG TPA: hypothetical protein PKC91_10670 [Ignavibacteria bacterium]|nr:hypothetical protein [Ignavibacteria bacterium]